MQITSNRMMKVSSPGAPRFGALEVELAGPMHHRTIGRDYTFLRVKTTGGDQQLTTSLRDTDAVIIADEEVEYNGKRMQGFVAGQQEGTTYNEPLLDPEAVFGILNQIIAGDYTLSPALKSAMLEPEDTMRKIACYLKAVVEVPRPTD